MSAAPAVTPTTDGCWYGIADHRPWASACPPACDGGGETHAERQADGAQHLYCDEHAHWRARDVGGRRIRRLRPEELA